MPIITMPTTSTPSPIVAAMQAAQSLATVPTVPAMRTAETDESVIEWIREHLAANPGAGKATMLKAFRAAGRKCNQTRFHGLVSRAQRPDKPATAATVKRLPPSRKGKAAGAAAEPVPSFEGAAKAWLGDEPAKAEEAPAEPKASKKAAKRSKGKGKGKGEPEAAAAPEPVVELDAEEAVAQHQTF